MRVRIAHLLLFLALLLTSGCGAPSFSQVVKNTPTVQPPSLSAGILPTATSGSIESTPSPTPSQIETETSTPGAFTLQFTPLPTETALPPLNLPTEVANPPVLQIWDGSPTYLSESKPDFYFRLRFDPTIWALTTDQYGFPALGDRLISGCIITPTAGRGLALNGSVEHDVRKIGEINYQVSTVFVNGVKQFVTYTGGDGNIYTAFQVSFQDQADQCLTDAESALAGLRSVAVSQATPIATP